MFGIDFSAWVPSPPPEHAFSGTPAVVVSLVCTVFAVFLSVRHIVMHLRNYTEPTYQRYIVRIIFMVPVRASATMDPYFPPDLSPPLSYPFPRPGLTSFSLCHSPLLSVTSRPLSTYLPTLCLFPTLPPPLLSLPSPPPPLLFNSYEAWVIHNFLSLCLSWVGGLSSVVFAPARLSLPVSPPFPPNSYEAWVIYNFLSLCLSWVGGPGAVVTSLTGRLLKPSYLLMTCCFPPIPLDGRFIRRCKQGCLQFVYLKPILAATCLCLYYYGLYEDGNFALSDGYIYITCIYMASYSVAIYALILFYVACRELLRSFNPVPKFLMIKAVVFLTYWQGVLVFIVAQLGYVRSAEDAADLQNVLICAEMVLGALGFMHAFPFKPFLQANVAMNGEQAGLLRSIKHAINLTDVVSDTVHQFAPTYHDYVLYSDGTGETHHYRTRTFVPSGVFLFVQVEICSLRCVSVSLPPLPIPLIAGREMESCRRSASGSSQPHHFTDLEALSTSDRPAGSTGMASQGAAVDSADSFLSEAQLISTENADGKLGSGGKDSGAAGGVGGTVGVALSGGASLAARVSEMVPLQGMGQGGSTGSSPAVSAGIGSAGEMDKLMLDMDQQ
ncbi:unnamed protein product [Closterium sp. NIES-65]|nr:unnamed protein product [Closterium sp. NIES-65]